MLNKTLGLLFLDLNKINQWAINNFYRYIHKGWMMPKRGGKVKEVIKHKMLLYKTHK